LNFIFINTPKKRKVQRVEACLNFLNPGTIAQKLPRMRNAAIKSRAANHEKCKKQALNDVDAPGLPLLTPA
jgi:hypothetical protein